MPWSSGPQGQAAVSRSAGRVHIHALRAVQLEKDKLVLFAGTDAGLFRSSNSGATWEQVKAAGITGVSGSGDLRAPERRLPPGRREPFRSVHFRGRRPHLAGGPAAGRVLSLRCGPAGTARSRNSGCNFARPFAVY